jgi:hypothetical protein
VWLWVAGPIPRGAAAPSEALLNEESFQVLHEESEALYEGDGSWGDRRYGYRMPLRDAAWRADVYGAVRGVSSLYERRAREAVGYLLKAQSEGGTGVFGFPADVNHPEFGDRVQQILAACATCAVNGWIVDAPGSAVSELYYDHGMALAAVARAYRRTPTASLRSSVAAAAEWAMDKPPVANINYLSTLAKGLSLASVALGDPRYVDRAWTLHQQYIFPGLDPATGQAVDAHNAQLEYHGFIVSGMATLWAALPAGDARRETLDAYLRSAVARMALRDRSEEGSYPATWPGTNAIAWREWGEIQAPSSTEEDARRATTDWLRSRTTSIQAESSAYRRRKALYSDFSLGFFTETSRPPSSGELDRVRAYPVPFRPTDVDAAVTFAPLPGGATVSIHTMGARRVRTLAENAGVCRWDGRDEDGRVVASGVYVFVVRSGGRERRGKVVLAR